MKKSKYILILITITIILILGVDVKNHNKSFKYISKNNNSSKIEENIEFKNNEKNNKVSKNTDTKEHKSNTNLNDYKDNYISNTSKNDLSNNEKHIKDNNSEEYIIKFNTNGGNSILEQKIKKNSKITKPNDPTKKGYKFKYWVKDNIKYNFNTLENSNVTLNAIWEKIESEKPNINPSIIKPNKPQQPVNPKKPYPSYPNKPVPFPNPVINPGEEKPTIPVPRPVKPKLEMK